MSYQVIARKYRPQRFSDVVGQEHITRTLANAIGQQRIAHAYLFCGPRGTGKTTIARIFSKCLNATDGPKVDFADDDPRCKEIAEGRSLDVLEIDGASNRGIDEIRELRETVKYAPASSRFKIYIIDEVHMLTKEAFNALLKTLEEPPAHVKFMFATTEPEKILPTILSRCQRFDLRRIPAAQIVTHLAHIAKQENVSIDDAALHAIARGADGGMRDAESTLDQLISFCGDKIEEPDVLSMFGLTAQSQILKIAGAILAGEAETTLREINDLAGHGKDLGRLLSDLLGHFRNLLLYQVSRGDLKLIEASEAEAAALADQSQSVNADALGRIMEALAEGERSLRDTPSKRILVEVTALKAIEARNSVNIDTVLRQLQQLRGDNGASASAVQPSERPATPALRETPSRSPAPAPAPAHAPPARKQSGSASTTVAISSDLGELWNKMVELAGRASPFTRSYLLEAHPVSFEKGVFTIGFDPEFADHLGLVDNARTHALLQTKMQELGHAGVQFRFVKAERPAGWDATAVAATPSVPAPAPPQSETGSAAASSPAPPKKTQTPMTKEDFKNDPLIKKALEIFKGQIVDVRS